jgi:spermidine synthase
MSRQRGLVESRAASGLLTALVFLSGAAALVYEVLWSRQLATFLGASSHAQAMVVAAYMAGLALGARTLGPLADRVRRPLLLVAALEAGIAGYAVASTWLLPALGSTWVKAMASTAPGLASDTTPAQLARLGVALLVLLPPTFLMGGTLPALVRALALGGADVGRTAGRIYGVNTVGAACGALLAGYALLPALGVRGSTLAAAAANALVAAAFVGLVTRPGDTAGAPAPSRSKSRAAGRGADVEHRVGAPLRPAARRTVLALFAWSGFLALAAQMAWVRALTLVIGSSVYAFAATLGVYLLGLGLGAWAAARWFSGRRGAATRSAPFEPSAALGLLVALELGLALSILLGLPALRGLPPLFLAAWQAGASGSFPLLQLVWLLLAAILTLVPTALSGALFPAVVAACRGAPERPGRDTGVAYAANSFGTVLGAPAAALWLLPTLGVARTLVAIALAHALIALALRSVERGGGARRALQRARRALALAVPCALVFALAAGRWDHRLMTSGPYINAFRLADPPGGRSLGEFLRERDELLFYREDVDGVVTVRDDGTERVLAINGKTDGTRLGDRRTQVAVALLPLLAAEQPRQVLVIGLGTGISAGVVAMDPTVERIDVVEISRAVVAASSFFDAESGAVLLDPRTRLHLQDARSFLLGAEGGASGSSWDVIVSEPSNPWISGVANLFTREAFELARGRLAPGGVMAQWFHVYGMSLDDLRSGLATFRSVFPHTTVWIPQTGDLVLLGSAEPVRLDVRRFRELARRPEARERLEPGKLLEERELLSTFLLGEHEVDRFAAGAPLNTDDRPRLELGAPRHLYRETTLGNLAAMARQVAGQEQPVPVDGLLERGYDPDRVWALGLDVGLEPGEVASADWLVGWTVLESAEAERGVRLLVTQSPTLRLGEGDRALTVRRTPVDELGGLALESYVEQRLDGTPDSGGEASLADGTSATWRAAAAGNAGLGFDCGLPAAFRFLALADGPDGPARLLALSARTRCGATLR